jgi:hypothetical protein
MPIAGSSAEGMMKKFSNPDKKCSSGLKTMVLYKYCIFEKNLVHLESPGFLGCRCNQGQRFEEVSSRLSAT